MVAPAFKEIT